MKKNRKAEILKYFVPPLITVAVILVIYAVKGQYPFGTGTMIDNDWGPADFPGFVRFWDVAHGKASLFFDWSTGLGLPKSAIGYFLYPVNYMLLPFKRDFLYEAMNYYYIAQMVTVSVTSFAFFRNAFKKLPLYYTYLFSLAFTFCGFNLQYYTNIGWLSSVAVLPLVMLATYKLLNGKGFVFYALILAYSLVISTYLTFFMLEGIVLAGTLFIFCFLCKEDRKGAAFRLGMGTVSAFLISFWSVFGFAFSTLGSTRVQNDTQSGFLSRYLDILKAENSVNAYKALMLLGMEIGVVVLALIVIKHRKEIKKALFFVFGFILFFLPIVFESIDLILNGGTYNYYPMRNGFLIAFFLCITAAYYFERFDSVNENEKNKVLAYLKPVLCVLAMYVTVPLYLVMTKTLSVGSALSNNGLMMGLSMIEKNAWGFLFVTVTAAVMLTLKKKSIRTVFLCILLIFVIGTDSYRLIGARETLGEDQKVERNITEYYILNCFALRDDIKNDDTFERICNPTNELIMNYPILVERTAVADWSHIVSSDFRNSFYQLGYGMVFTSIGDSGSTAFARALLGIKDGVSTVSLNEDLFLESKKLKNDFTYYNARYVLPLGVTFDDKAFGIEFDGNFFEYQNSIFSDLTDNGKLFSKCEALSEEIEEYTDKVKTRYSDTLELDQDKYKGTFTYHIDEKSVLYFCLDDGSDISVDDIVVTDCVIDVNGERLFIPSNNSTSAELYRNGVNNNVIELGTFENEDITIELNSTHSEIDKPVVYAMSLEKLGELCDGYESCVTEYSTGKDSITVKANGEKGKYLFIPVYNNGGWECTVNGEKTEVGNVLGSFMAIALQDGENDISIRYVPKTFYVTFAFSIAVLLGFALAMLFVKKRKIQAPEKLQTLFLWALTGLFTAFIAIAYIAPLIAQIYYAFVGRE